MQLKSFGRVAISIVLIHAVTMLLCASDVRVKMRGMNWIMSSISRILMVKFLAFKKTLSFYVVVEL